MASTELIEQVLPKTSSCYTEACMRDFHDAYGHALRDYLDGKGRGYEIIERDDGYADVSGGRAMSLAHYPNWPSRHRQAVRYAKGRVLDIGCGAGRQAD